jgi:hypothetical protein
MTIMSMGRLVRKVVGCSIHTKCHHLDTYCSPDADFICVFLPQPKIWT